MTTINKVILVANLGADPEVRYGNNGDAVATLSVATSDTWKDKNTGDKVERTEWHRVVAFKKLAEITGEYHRKGDKLYIEGKLQTRKWQDKDNNDRYSTEIVADTITVIDSKSSGKPAANSNQNDNSAQGNNQQG